MIGKFEELTLLALLRSGPNSNAAKVYNVLEGGVSSPPPFAALYTALDRMVKKGMISEVSDTSDKRARRLFTITGEGRHALDEALTATRALGGNVWGTEVLGGANG
ncbi:PadR family transcriptional regulator [Agrobacterium sp. BA1120]|uniref:PadR family transcriptional regulator n=1 Tax=Agrobacterium sp. BA1120 TaxID=3228927 RepID=UPI00336A119C